jgi:hypothetical protein
MDDYRGADDRGIEEEMERGGGEKPNLDRTYIV